jgi:hypothetical protein
VEGAGRGVAIAPAALRGVVPRLASRACCRAMSTSSALGSPVSINISWSDGSGGRGRWPGGGVVAVRLEARASWSAPSSSSPVTELPAMFMSVGPGSCVGSRRREKRQTGQVVWPPSGASHRSRQAVWKLWLHAVDVHALVVDESQQMGQRTASSSSSGVDDVGAGGAGPGGVAEAPALAGLNQAWARWAVPAHRSTVSRVQPICCADWRLEERPKRALLVGSTGPWRDDSPAGCCG